MINLDDGHFNGWFGSSNGGSNPHLATLASYSRFVLGWSRISVPRVLLLLGFAGLGRMEVVQMTYFARSAFTGSEALNRVTNKNIPPIFR